VSAEKFTGGQRKNQGRKIAPLSLSLENSGAAQPPPPPPIPSKAEKISFFFLVKFYKIKSSFKVFFV